MTLREATINDVAVLFEIRCSVEENHMSMEQLARIGVTPTSLGEMIQGGDYVTPIVEVGGRAVGFAMAQVSRCHLFGLFVRPGYENRGVGRAALQAAEAELRKRGVTHAWLCTDQNPICRAHGFYSRLGWMHSGYMDDGQARYEKAIG